MDLDTSLTACGFYCVFAGFQGLQPFEFSGNARCSIMPRLLETQNPLVSSSLSLPEASRKISSKQLREENNRGQNEEVEGKKEGKRN